MAELNLNNRNVRRTAITLLIILAGLHILPNLLNDILNTPILGQLTLKTIIAIAGVTAGIMLWRRQ